MREKGRTLGTDLSRSFRQFLLVIATAFAGPFILGRLLNEYLGYDQAAFLSLCIGLPLALMILAYLAVQKNRVRHDCATLALSMILFILIGLSNGEL